MFDVPQMYYVRPSSSLDLFYLKRETVQATFFHMYTHEGYSPSTPILSYAVRFWLNYQPHNDF